MAWGAQSWDENGKPNNYGLVPVTVAGKIQLSLGQVSGSWSFAVPSGYILDYIQCPTSFGYTTTRRSVTINGGTVTIGSAAESNFGAGSEAAQAAFLVIYVRKV